MKPTLTKLTLLFCVLCFSFITFGQTTITNTLNTTSVNYSNQNTSLSGSVTIPSCVSTVTVQCWGAGGGGGGAQSTAISGTGAAGDGGGGGGGGYSSSTIATAGTYTYSVGAGGWGGNLLSTFLWSGNAGGNTKVSNSSGTVIVNANGGGGGGSGLTTGGSAGSAGTGTTHNGGAGYKGTFGCSVFGVVTNILCNTGAGGGGGGGAGSSGNGSNGSGAPGGAAGSGTGGGAGASAPTSGNTNGNLGTGTGTTWGGGGSGAFSKSTSFTIKQGGNGGNGQIVFSYTMPAPTVASFSPTYYCGTPASNLVITGCGFMDIAGNNLVSALTINGTAISSSNYTVNSGTQITIPYANLSGLSSGYIAVTTKYGATTIGTGSTSGNSSPNQTLYFYPTPILSSQTTYTSSGYAFSYTPTGTIPTGTAYSWSAPSGSGFTGGTTGSGSLFIINGNLTNTTASTVTANYAVTATAGSCSDTFTVSVIVTTLDTVSGTINTLFAKDTLSIDTFYRNFGTLVYGDSTFKLAYSVSNLVRYPNKQGQFLYYANLEIDTVPIGFDKTAFLNYLSTTGSYSSAILSQLSSAITSVSKTYTQPLSPLLARSLSIFSPDPHLDTILKYFINSFHFFEITSLPNPKGGGLLGETNDYAPSPDQASKLDLINVSPAWDLVHGDPRVKIGFTDTYLETTHEDLQGNIIQVLANLPLPGTSPITNPSDPILSYWHGVATAGCLSAMTNNNKGIAAPSYNCSLVFSSNWGDDNVVQSIASISGVRVINLSWYNGCSYSVTQDNQYTAIQSTYNVVIVGSAGNITSDCGSLSAPIYPAALSSPICVSSVGHYNDIGVVDPTYGPIYWKDCHQAVIGDPTSSHHHFPQVDIVAPGYSIYSTGPGGCDHSPSMSNPCPAYAGNSYTHVWGTSFSGPCVASACALVACANPCLTANQIRDIVLNTADPTLYTYSQNALYTSPNILGAGRLDVSAAVQRAIALGTTYQQDLTYSSTSTVTSQTDITAGAYVTTTLPNGVVKMLNGSNTTYQAAHFIILSDDFEVEDGAIFEAQTVDSPCF